MPHTSKIATSLLLFVVAWLGIGTKANAYSGIQYTERVPNWAPVPRTDENLNDFIQKVTNGQAGVLTGVYVSDVMAYPVVQQPSSSPAFVSSEPATLTQFRMASQYGTTGLLAHNTLAGADYYKLEMGKRIVLVNGDGSVKEYQISLVARYQALSPQSPYSDFVDLDHPEKRLSATDLFYDVYSGEDQVVFQTCIENEGNPSWGRMFITAVPNNPAGETVLESSYLTAKFTKLLTILN